MTQDRRLNLSQAQQARDPSEYRVCIDATVPDNFPLPLSSELSTYLYTPDCTSHYESVDTWFLSWAADDLLYSGFTDGTVDHTSNSSGAANPDLDTTTGHTIIIGSNLLNLTIISLDVCTSNTGQYTGRYPSANLHYNGVWYQSTYGLSENDAPCDNWCVQGLLISFRYSLDQGHSWYDYNLHPKNHTDYLFNQSSSNRQKIIYGALLFVDFD
ncbi:unnamed protein product [Rotaria sordida]|uniref:Uncharacterized protein n=1 Tax=Rotaria sordida TaxID=392033 RepID=A0A815KEG4_9BILA|nr:unnamed protein product [Rotaria sordida]CAF1458850.1 unnamed protein product [Rotaria sordida]CAF3998046.1 unnamed protein product [Rotaria sordida]